MEKFSVIMCLYNGDNSTFFKEAFKSVINQTVKPNEILLVIDGPINYKLENSVEWASNICPYLKIIKLDENKGHGAARRVGFENCNNELIAIMDSDDICAFNRFELQLNAFASTKADAIGGQISEFIDNPTNIIGTRIVPKNDMDIKRYAKKRCPMNQVSVMMKRSAYFNAGGYIDWYQDEDYYLWTRMILKKAIFFNLDEVLVYVRVGKDMYSRRGGMKYFKSERRLQRFMLERKMITVPRYFLNVAERYFVQVLMTNRIRQLFFKLIRSKK